MKNRVLIVGMWLAFVSVQAAFGQGTWTATGGNWTTAGSWTKNSGVTGVGYPDSDDTATIPTGVTITVTGGAQALSITIQNGGTLTINTGNSTFTTMDVQAGSHCTTGATGQTDIKNLTVSGTMNLGLLLRMFPGTSVLTVNSSGTMNDTGVASEIQFSGSSTFTMNGTIQPEFITFSGANQIVTITGNGTVLTTRFFVTATPVTIHLNNDISSGGSFGSSPNAFNLSQPSLTIDGTGTMNVSGGNFNLSASLFSVGCKLNVVDLAVLAASSSMTITNGGVVTVSDDLRIGPGANNGDTFVLKVLSGGTLAVSSDVLFDDGGTAPVTGNNFTMTNDGTTTITGIIDINNRTTEKITNTGTFTINGATSITNAPAANPTLFINDINGTFNVAGDIDNDVTLDLTASPNTVNYTSNGGSEIEDPTTNNYHHIIIGGGSNRTLRDAIIVAGNLTIEGTAILNVGTFDISVAGNWTNTSSNGDPFVQSTGARTVTFNGTAQQTISNSGNANGTVFNAITFNNTLVSPPQIVISNGVNVTAQTTLTMTKGVINLSNSASTITLGTAVATPGTLVHSLASTAGWVYGAGGFIRFYNTPIVAVGTAAALFPVGSAADFRPFYLGSTAVTSGGSYKVSHTNATTTSIVSIVDDNGTIIRRHNAFWTGAIQTGITTGTWAIQAGGTGYGVVASIADLRLCQLAAEVGTTSLPNAGNTTAPLINKVAFTVLTELNRDFYVGSVTSASSLPVTLTDFWATPEEGRVALHWTTASEVNNDYFNVERSTDGESFTSFAKVQGAGKSFVTKNYSVADEFPPLGRTYYRLKQTDYDGSHDYSKIISVTNLFAESKIQVSPNPVRIGHDLSLKIVNPMNEITNVSVQLFDLMGKPLLRETEYIGQNSFKINTSDVRAAGFYILRVRALNLNRDFFQRVYLSNE